MEENKKEVEKEVKKEINNKENKLNKDKVLENIQNISLKISDIARILIIIATLFLIILIAVKAFYKTGYFPATYDNALEKTDYKYDNILENIAYISLVLTIVYVFQRILEKIKLKYVIPIILILILTLFIWFVLTLDLVPIADQGQIMILGEAISNHIVNLHVNPGNYLEMFPYQFGFAYYVGCVISIVNGIQNIFNLEYFNYLQVLNSIYSIICMVFMYLIGNRLLKEDNKSKNVLLVLIMLFGAYFMFLNTHVYAIIPGLMFALLAFLCTIRFIQDRKWYNLVITAISMFIAIYLKTNYQIFLIAIIGILGLEFLKKIEIKNVLSIILVMVIYVTGSSIGDYIFKENIQRDIPLGVPMMTYMYMGWAPSNTLSSGWYTGDVINLYTDNKFDHIETAEKTKELIYTRYNYFINNFEELFRYAWDKFDSTWLNPTFQTIWCATPGLDRIYTNEEYKNYIEEENSWLKDVLSYNSDVFHVEERLFDSYEIIIFACASIGIINMLKEKDKENEKLLLIVTFLGGVVFHFVLWETKAVYVLGYYYLLLPYTAKGLTILFEKLERLFKNIFNKIKNKSNTEKETKKVN